MTNRDHIEALKKAADPGRVADALGLRGRGGRYFCPDCQPTGGKSPDLVIRDGGFICHKCGSKGDILSLILTVSGLDFPGAVGFLEGLTGLQPRGGPGRAARARPGRSRTPSSVPARAAAPDPAIYAAFLEGCRPVEGAALAWLAGELAADPGEVAALAGGLGLRFCGREYQNVMKGLADRFGDEALLTAGMVKRSKAGRPVPSFWHYYAKKAGFLVIPYLKDGQPVFLKARPPVGKEDAERLKLIRFMNTGVTIPCLYNVDVLKSADRVLICEGESDTWAALAAGWAAVGAPGAKQFRADWVALFRGFRGPDGRSSVFLAFDRDAAGAEGSRMVADLFLKAGLPIPRQLTIPEGQGKDLRAFLKGGMTA